MEVCDILNIARIKLADPLAPDGSDGRSLFKQDELLYYLNNALREAVFRGKLLVKQTYSINLLASNTTGEYPVPTGAIDVTQILDENNHDIVKIQEVDFRQKTFNSYNDNFGSTMYRNDWRNDTNDLPYCFIQNYVNNKIRFYPIPTKDSVVTVRATYVPHVDLEDYDEIPTALSAIYQPDLLYWLLYEAYDKKDADTYNPDEAEINKRRFAEIFGEKLEADQFMEMINYPDDPGSLRDY